MNAFVSTRAAGAVVFAAAVAGMAIGGYVGYRYAEEKLAKEFDEHLEAQLEAARRHYSVLYKRDKFSTPASAAEQLLPMEAQALEAMDLYQGTIERTEDGVEFERAGFVATEFENTGDDTENRESVGVVTNIFDRTDEEEAEVAMAWEHEVNSRTEDAPYLISYEEFAEENGNSKVELTWYAGDKTLVDEREDIITDVDETIGEYNLDRFGQWSNDLSIVYVRNPRTDSDFEITRSSGHFGTLAGFVQ